MNFQLFLGSEEHSTATFTSVLEEPSQQWPTQNACLFCRTNTAGTHQEGTGTL